MVSIDFLKKINVVWVPLNFNTYVASTFSTSSWDANVVFCNLEEFKNASQIRDSFSSDLSKDRGNTGGGIGGFTPSWGRGLNTHYICKIHANKVFWYFDYVKSGKFIIDIWVTWQANGSDSVREINFLRKSDKTNIITNQSSIPVGMSKVFSSLEFQSSFLSRKWILKLVGFFKINLCILPLILLWHCELPNKLSYL